MNEQEARTLAEALQQDEVSNDFIVKGVVERGDGTWAVWVWDEVNGNVMITQAHPKESVEMQREHVESVLVAYDSLSVQLSLQQFYDIVQGVWKQHPFTTPNAIATYTDVLAEEFHITNPQAITARINQFLGGVEDGDAQT